MADILLVHGSCHGAWCWYEVVPRLTARGHRVRVLDLPGHGADQTPIGQVTLEAYAQAIAVACADQTVLVGHSMGGYAITAAALLVPDQITRLVYLCAYVPQDGVTLAQMRGKAPTQPLLPAIRKAADGHSFTVDPALAPGIFYHDCTPEHVAFALPRLCPQPIAPTETALHNLARIATIPRRYIRCLEDRTIPPAFQVTMTADWPEKEVQEMGCGHSPFFAAPDGLARRLDQAITGWPMAASVFDSPLYAKLFPTGEAGRLFSDSAALRAMLLVEGALAKVQGEAGVIPQISAAAIHRATLEIQIDPGAIASETGWNGVSVPGLVATFRKEMNAPEHAQYVHWGATSQDIIDTGLMLRLRQLLALAETALTALLGKLADQAKTEYPTLPDNLFDLHAQLGHAPQNARRFVARVRAL